jgi:hypothetical protein
MSGPTKTPWIARGRYIGTANSMSSIAECIDQNGNWSNEPKALANAALIVRAVNAHAALAEYFHASESLQMTIGHPEASSSDEEAAENRFRLAKVAARDALVAKAGAA